MNYKFAKWIYDSQHSYINILEGAIRVGKDFMATRAFIERIRSFQGDADMFMVSAVSIKQTYRTVGQYILDYCGHDAQSGRDPISNAPCVRLKTPNGTKTIIFTGGEKEGSDTDIQGLTLGGVYFVEINLLHPDFIDQAIKRTGADGDRAFIFGTLNPKSARHIFYTKYLNVWEAEPSKGYLNYMHCALEDSPALSPDDIEFLKKGKDPNSVEYKRDILGLRHDAEGKVFKIYDYTIIDKWDPADYVQYITVADPGVTKSSTVFILAALNLKTKSMDILKEYTWKNQQGTIAQKHSIDLVKEFMKFNKECFNMMGKWPMCTIVDSYLGADWLDYCIIESRKDALPLNIKMPIRSDGKQGKDEDSVRISRGNALLYNNQLHFDRDCIHCIHDIEDAEYDAKALEKGEDKISEVFDGSGHSDALDCIMYACAYFKNYLEI